MIIAYMDESGHFDDPECRYVGMAGFAGPQELWDPFGILWDVTIRSSPFHLMRPFHMREFAHRRGEFEGWSEEKRKALYAKLIEAILLIQPIPFGAMVSISDFKSLTPEQQLDFKSPYHLAFQTCTRGAAISALKPHEVNMVFSENLDYGAVQSDASAGADQLGDAHVLWRAIKELTLFGEWMGECSFSSPAVTPQLQAADLFAYELYKEFENQQRRPDLPMRWGLRQILSLYPPEVSLIRLFDRKELLRTIIEANLPHKEHTEEVGDVDSQMAVALKTRSDWIRARALQKTAE